MNMKLLLFIFLITRTQQYFFDQLIQNDTYMGESRLQEFNQQSEKTSIRSMISNKVLVTIVACLSIVVIGTLLTVYFAKDQIRDFATRIGIGQRAPVIHKFHPEVLLHSSIREQHKQPTPSYEQTHGRLPASEKPNPLKSANGSDKRERTSVHTFMNSSTKRQQDSISDYRHSQSAANLFLYH